LTALLPSIGATAATARTISAAAEIILIQSPQGVQKGKQQHNKPTPGKPPRQPTRPLPPLHEPGNKPPPKKA
jgi:hypothetical protein